MNQQVLPGQNGLVLDGVERAGGVDHLAADVEELEAALRDPELDAVQVAAVGAVPFLSVNNWKKN